MNPENNTALARKPGRFARKSIIFLALIFRLVPPLMAQSQMRSGGGLALSDILPEKHAGALTSLVHTGTVILSAGADGFLGIWDESAALDRFQISPFRIEAVTKHPEKNEVCVIEYAGADKYRVSAWDYTKKEKLFSLDFDDRVRGISYSAAGGLIIAAAEGETGLRLLDALTGEVLEAFESPPGTAAIAATGRAERNMLAYFPGAGEIVYMDLPRGDESGRFSAEAGVSSPIVFGGNRYLAGMKGAELVVLDAATGAVLGRNSAVGQNSLLCAGGDEFYCLSRNKGGARLYRFGIDRSGRLENREGLSLSFAADGDPETITSISANGSAALGTRDGRLLIAGPDGKVREAAHGSRIRIVEIAVSGSSIAFLTEDKNSGFLPLDYRLIEDEALLFPQPLERGYTNISPLAPEGGGEGRFLFWQDETPLPPPEIRSAGKDRPPAAFSGAARFPLRAVSSTGEKILFLDSAGTLSVVSLADGGKTPLFSFSAPGAIDAAFIDGENIIIGRAAISSNAPFLKVSSKTGETVPLPWPAQAGVMVRPSRPGSVYAAAFEQRRGTVKNSIILLDTSAPARSPVLAEFPGEDTRFSIAESWPFAASNLGGEETVIFAAAGSNQIEKRICPRTAGLPVKLAGAPRFFIILDSEGTIGWFENSSGRLLALFKLYAAGWLVQS
jgi:hypothetical protein